MTTIAEIFARFPPGDERLKALEEWRRAQFNEGPPQQIKPPPTTKPQQVEIPTPVHPDSELARSAWERRRDAAQEAKEAESAAAIKARVQKAVELTMARSVRIADAKDRQAKMLRLGELQALLEAAGPKSLGRINGTLADIEARLARLVAD